MPESCDQDLAVGGDHDAVSRDVLIPEILDPSPDLRKRLCDRFPENDLKRSDFIAIFDCRGGGRGGEPRTHLSHVVRVRLFGASRLQRNCCSSSLGSFVGVVRQPGDLREQ